MSRLPTPGSDVGNWGSILNDYLSVSLNADGTIKASAIAGKADDSAVVHNSGSEAVAGVKTFTSSPIVPTPSAGTDTANKSYVDGVAVSGAPNANASTPGLVQLAGDLSGTYNLPTVPALSGKESSITAGTTSQYWRGDKSWQTLDKSAVGLSNVDNTSDVNKPVSTAAQTALSGKESSITAGTTSQYWRGDKSWQTLDKSAVGLSNVDNTSDVNKPVSTATQSALNAKQDTSDINVASGYAGLDSSGHTALGLLPAGSTLTVVKDSTTGFWPASYNSDGTPNYTSGSASAGVRPTSRSDVIVIWKGPDPSPGIVSSGTGGMLDNVDMRFVTP